MNAQAIRYSPYNNYNPGAYAQYLPQLPKLEDKTKKVITYAVLGSVAVYVGYRIYLNVRAKEAQKKTYDSDKPESYAQEIFMALQFNNWLGWGTDNVALRQTLLKIPSKDYMKQVVEAYAKLNKGRSMMADIASDLTTTEYQELLAIIEAKPHSGNTLQPQTLTDTQYTSWVKRIQAAFNASTMWITYTDHPMLMQVLKEVPSKAAFERLKNVYKSIIGTDLMLDMKDRVSLWYSGDVKAIIDSKQ